MRMSAFHPERTFSERPLPTHCGHRGMGQLSTMVGNPE
jgi:hypothetical protein